MAMKTLSIIESAYRATIEEQDDTIVWLHGAMKGAGADVAVLLRGNAVNYLLEGQDSGGLAFGEWRQTQPPRLASDLAALAGKGVEICYVAEDMADRGIAQAQIIAGAQPVSRAALADLITRYDRVWYW
jgi:sulfur relay (sulfurtransferase) DsrF/TusC family protein